MNTEKEKAKKGPAQTSLGLDENLSAVLAYLFFAFGGVIFYVLEKESRIVRFAAMQSILYTVFVIASFFIGGLFLQPLTALGGWISIFTNFLGTAFLIGVIAVWFLLMYRSFNNQEWELPFIGKMARDTVK